ncbi:MAG: hypoxanthine phosphoribosyltransferase [Williamsia sp.]|nr:hypoxanthine phosphoribosyltransferase [Williamsia sp.]
MANIQVHDKVFEPYLNAEEIQEKIVAIADTLNRDYQHKKPLFIAILNGAFMFASDLFKCINIEAEICFIKLASYKGTKSSGQVITAIGLDTDLVGRHLVVLEDIVDTGKTLDAFLPQLRNQQPASLTIAALLQKPDALLYPLEVQYVGFKIPDKFVVGYGLDYNGLGRNIDRIYKLVE